MKMLKNSLAALAIASLPLVAACGEKVSDESPETATKDDGTITLAAALANAGQMAKLRDAMTQGELAGLLEGPASYTVLAPTDAAFDAMGADGSALFTADQKPVLVALLREHMVPGHLTPETIAKAIADKGGPVTMTTLGQGQVTFSQDGDNLTVTAPSGAKAVITGTSIAANNGVVIPLDTVLLPAKEG